MKKENTKLMRTKLKEYATSSNGDSLYYVYKTCSAEKWRAYEYCKELMLKYEGRNGKVLSGNTFTFSYAFTGVYEGKIAFFYITRDNDRVMIIEEAV